MIYLDLIFNAISLALPFYISALPIIFIHILLTSEKRSLLNIGFNVKEKIFTLGLILSILFVLGITIGNNSPINLENLTSSSLNIIPFKGLHFQYIFALTGDIHSIINLFGNILVFIPLGFFLSVYYKDDSKANFKVIIIAIILTFSIEYLQLFMGRASDITDIILNTSGVYLGRLLFLYFNILFENFFNTIHLKTMNSINKKVKCLNLLQIFMYIVFFALYLS